MSALMSQQIPELQNKLMHENLCKEILIAASLTFTFHIFARILNFHANISSYTQIKSQK